MGEINESLERVNGFMPQVRTLLLQNLGIVAGVVTMFVMAKFADVIDFEAFSLTDEDKAVYSKSLENVNRNAKGMIGTGFWDCWPQFTFHATPQIAPESRRKFRCTPLFFMYKLRCVSWSRSLPNHDRALTAVVPCDDLELQRSYQSAFSRNLEPRVAELDTFYEGLQAGAYFWN